MFDALMAATGRIGFAFMPDFHRLQAGVRGGFNAVVADAAIDDGVVVADDDVVDDGCVVVDRRLATARHPMFPRAVVAKTIRRHERVAIG